MAWRPFAPFSQLAPRESRQHNGPCAQQRRSTRARTSRMVEADDLGHHCPLYQQGSANCYLATASAFASNTISGASFAFASTAKTNSGNLKAFSGHLQRLRRKQRQRQYRQRPGAAMRPSAELAFTATYTAPGPSHGPLYHGSQGARATPPASPFTSSTPIACSFSITPRMTANRPATCARSQQAPYSGASINGPFVSLHARGRIQLGRASTPSGYYSHVFRGRRRRPRQYGHQTKATRTTPGVYSAGQIHRRSVRSHL